MPLRMMPAARAGTMIALAALPLSTSNRTFVSTALGGPGILDQDGTESCCGYAAAFGITTRFAIMRAPIALVSPIGCYIIGCDILRTVGSDGKLPAFTDSGTEPDAVWQGTMTYGVCKASTWGNFPADPATITSEPTPAQLQAAKDFVLKGAYFLGGSQAQLLLQLLQVLATGYPVTNLIPSTNPSFDNYTGGVIPASGMTGTIDHCTTLLDYAWNGDQASFTAFVASLQAGTVDMNAIVQLVLYGGNSWGEDWGESDVPGISGGFYRMQAEALFVMSSLAVCDVAPVSPTEVIQ
jgi:hypothetical protein